jgi:hypothetical protein
MGVFFVNHNAKPADFLIVHKTSRWRLKEPEGKTADALIQRSAWRNG